MTPIARIARTSAAFLGSNLARGAIGFGMSLVLARGLGAGRFGSWTLCMTWASTLMVIADLGFGVLLTRDGARPGTDAAEARRLLTGALILRLVVAAPLGVLLVAGASALGADPESIAGLRLAALLGIVSV